MAITYNTSIVKDGLVLHLDAANVKSYPGTGNTWFDLSGNGNNGTLQGGLSAINYVFVFDGIDDYVSTNYAPNLDNNRLYTYELTFMDNDPGNFNSNLSLISNYGLTATVPWSGLHINEDGTLRFSERNSVSGSVTLTSNNVVDGQWKHIVGVANASTLQLYVNGVFVSIGNRPGGIITSGQSYVLGSQHLGRFQSCNIDMFRIYMDKALTQNEISKNFNALRGRYGI